MKQNIEIEVPEGYKAVYNPTTGKVKVVEIDTKPKSWEEFCEKTSSDRQWFIAEDVGVKECSNPNVSTGNRRMLFNTKREAEAFLALMQLRQLRKSWIGDWKPAFAPNDGIYCAIIYGLDLVTNLVQVHLILTAHDSHVLLFPSEGMAREFLECFKDLIEKAKTLL